MYLLYNHQICLVFAFLQKAVGIEIVSYGKWSIYIAIKWHMTVFVYIGCCDCGFNLWNDETNISHKIQDAVREQKENILKNVHANEIDYRSAQLSRCFPFSLTALYIFLWRLMYVIGKICGINAYTVCRWSALRISQRESTLGSRNRPEMCTEL